jgi:two-component system, NarL family, invasion response regulator UvrY
MQPKILLTDDHSMIRKGMKLLIQSHLKYSDVQEVTNCNELMKELANRKYTHLILDIILPDGNTLEILPGIRSLYPELHIMMFSMQPAEVYGKAVKQYGVHHYLHKSSPEEDTILFLQRFLQNEQTDRSNAQDHSPHNPFSILAPRELEILHYLLKGMGTKEIAEILNLKLNTISTVKTNIYEKTRTTNYIELRELAAVYNVI